MMLKWAITVTVLVTRANVGMKPVCYHYNFILSIAIPMSFYIQYYTTLVTHTQKINVNLL